MNEERWIEFEIIKEPWNKYQLQDNSVLKMRTVLKSIRRLAKKNGVEYLVGAQILIVVHAASDLRGDVNPSQVSNDEIVKCMEIEDMHYDSLAQESNEYLLDDGAKIKVHTNTASISRSILKDMYGDSIYSVQHNNQILIKPPKS